MPRFLFAFAMEKQSPLTRLHPITVLVAASSLVVVIFSTTNVYVYLGMLALLALVIWTGRLPARNTFAILVVVVPLCFFITLIQALAQPGPALFSFSVLGRTIAFTRSGVFLGLVITLRVVLLALVMTIMFTIVHPARMTRALYNMGVPFKYAYAFTLALRFLPLVIDELDTINNAQKSRGYDIDRVNFLLKVFKVMPLMTPLIINCLRRANTISLAMDLRAFGASRQRTFYVELAPPGPADRAIWGLSTAVAVAAIAVAIVW